MRHSEWPVNYSDLPTAVLAEEESRVESLVNLRRLESVIIQESLDIAARRTSIRHLSLVDLEGLIEIVGADALAPHIVHTSVLVRRSDRHAVLLDQRTVNGHFSLSAHSKFPCLPSFSRGSQLGLVLIGRPLREFNRISDLLNSLNIVHIGVSSFLFVIYPKDTLNRWYRRWHLLIHFDCGNHLDR